MPVRVPFSAIDEAVQILDAEPAPWSIQLEVAVTRAFDEHRLRKAVHEALLRHPMAHARKVAVSAFARGSQWEIDAELDLDPVRVVECWDDGTLTQVRADFYSFSVPLVESPPVRARLVRRRDGDMLLLNINHAAFDGFGGLRVLRSIARAYAGEPDPQADFDFSRARDLEALTGGPRSGSALRRARLVGEKLSDLVGAPARIARQGCSELPGYGFHHLRLSAEETGKVISARRKGATVNDLLLAALHIAVARWNEQRGVRSRRIGVLVPVNLLPSPERRIFVGNYSVPVRVLSSRRERSSPDAAIEAVTAQTKRIKQDSSAALLADLLTRPAALPVWVKRALPALLWLTGNRLVDTAQLSNLGKVDEMPSFGPDAGPTRELWFSPPARMPLGVAIGAVTGNGCLHLVFRYRHALFDAEAAGRFAQEYVSSLFALS